MRRADESLPGSPDGTITQIRGGSPRLQPWEESDLLELEIEVECDLVRHVVVHRRGCSDFLV